MRKISFTCYLNNIAMRKISFTCFIVIVISITFLQAQDQEVRDSLAYQYILDYDVPESPAFSVLGVNPNTVMRGSAAKPIAVHLANQLISGGKVDNGIALDFNPYFSLLGGRLKNISEYRENYGKRLLANMQWSVATTALEEYPNDLVYGLGSRFTLWDSKDLLFDKGLGQKIDDCLAKDEDGAPEPGGEDKIEDIKFNCMKNNYDEIRKELTNMKGGSISLGWAMSGRIEGATLRSDSFNVLRNQIWLSGQYSLGKGFDLLGLLMQRFEYGDGAQDQTTMGLAVRYNKPNVSFSGELVYQNNNKKGIFDGGFNFGFKVLPRLMYVFHLATRDDPDNVDAKKKIVIRSGIRWNFSESYSKR